MRKINCRRPEDASRPAADRICVLDGAKSITSNSASQPGPGLRRQAEALHRRGPRPVGEILLELIGRWGPAFEADLGQRLDRYLRIPTSIYRAVGASEYPPAPIHAVLDLDVEMLP